MAEHLEISGNSKEELYSTLYPQLVSLAEGEPDLIANMANFAACIKETFNFWWVGFYLVGPSASKPGLEELILGPFQGPLACTRIRKGKGVCGTTWDRSETVIVPDVEKFPGHIACSSASKSEIVVPLVRDGVVYAVLDIDSEFLNTFDQTDRRWLEKIAVILDNSKMH